MITIIEISQKHDVGACVQLATEPTRHTNSTHGYRQLATDDRSTRHTRPIVVSNYFYTVSSMYLWFLILN